MLWWFVGTTIFGVIVSLGVVYFASPAVEPIASSPVEVATGSAETPSASARAEIDKQYVEQFADRTKWLETIAYGALAGLVGLRWSRENLVRHATIAIAAGCLTVSLFNGYRAHDQILQALQTHTPQLLATTSSRLIVAFQFWFLALAIGLLAARVLSIPRSHHRNSAAAAAVGLVLFASPYAHGQDKTKPATVSQNCIESWVGSRYSRKPTTSERKILATIVNGTAQEKNISADAQAGCSFSESVLDYVANGSYGLNDNRDYMDLMEFADDLANAISSHHFSDTPFQNALWAAVEIWHQKRGVLRVRSATAGDEVSVDGTRVGLTPLTCGIKPGKYELRVSRMGRTIGYEQIEVNDGQELQRVFQ